MEDSTSIKRTSAIDAGMKASVVEKMIEKELKKCNGNISLTLSGNLNLGNSDGFTRNYKYNYTFPLKNGEKIKVAKIDEITLPSGRKVEAFIDKTGNKYFQYRASDGTVLKPEYFAKQEKMGFDSCFTIRKGKIVKTNITETIDAKLKDCKDYTSTTTLKFYNENDKKAAKELHHAFKKNETKTIERILKNYNVSSGLFLAYNDIFQKDLSKDILNYSGIDDSLKEKVFKIYHGYDDRLAINDSKIKNSYWEGDSFNVRFDRNKVFITNKSTKDKAYIDMDKLFKDMNILNKTGMMKEVQKLPGEVLFDLSIECKKISSKDDDILTNIIEKMKRFIGMTKTPANGYYFPGKDEIVTVTDYSTIIHELGHAIDYRYKYMIFNYSEANSNNKFNEAFKKGLERYKKAGYEQYDDARDNWHTDNENCSKDSNEMFAECYMLLMTGIGSSAILEYFPECIEEAKNILKATRKLPKDVRR